MGRDIPKASVTTSFNNVEMARFLTVLLWIFLFHKVSDEQYPSSVEPIPFQQFTVTLFPLHITAISVDPSSSSQSLSSSFLRHVSALFTFLRILSGGKHN